MALTPIHPTLKTSALHYQSTTHTLVISSRLNLKTIPSLEPTLYSVEAATSLHSSLRTLVAAASSLIPSVLSPQQRSPCTIPIHHTTSVIT